MFSNLLSSINDNIFEFLDELVFINAGMTKNLIPILGTNFHSGINLICNSLIYGFLLYYALSYLLSHITFTQIENPFQFIFKLILCAIALNFSWFLCSGLITICSHLSTIICELGNDLFGFNISFSALIEDVIPKKYFLSDSFSLFSFDRFAIILYDIWVFKSCCFLCNTLHYAKSFNYNFSLCYSLII